MQNRRSFIKSAMAMPLALSGTSVLGTLGGFNAHAMGAGDYRALVCVFLFGGMDCHDTLLPFDDASYNEFRDIRSTLLDFYAAHGGETDRAQRNLLPLEPATPLSGGRQLALPPQMAALHGLFESGNAAIVGNVGPLVVPTDRSGFLAGGQLPSRLFSHNDQQSNWMSFSPEGAQLGWGGRFGDIASTAGVNADETFAQISVSGNTVFLSGDNVSTFQITAAGVPSIELLDYYRGSQLGDVLRAHFEASGASLANLLQRDYVDVSRRSLSANDKLDAALSRGQPVTTPFPDGALGAQLRAVAQTMAVRDSLGASRQVFFVGVGGFDTHANQARDLPALQREVSDGIAAFYRATQELGIENDVTTFTASDFGRTLTANGDGTDHGWGGHQFVVGGGVAGGDIYGDVPEATLGHDLDSGNGRLIPSTSVQQFAAPLGTWFGLDSAGLNAALPGLDNFPVRALGYL